MSEVLAEVNDTQLGLWVQWRKGDRGRGTEGGGRGREGGKGEERRGGEGGRGERRGGRGRRGGEERTVGRKTQLNSREGTVNDVSCH